MAGFFFVLEHATVFDPAAGAAEQHNRELGGVVIAGEHGGAEQQHCIVQQSARAFLDGIELRVM